MNRRFWGTTTALALLAALFLVVGAGAGTARGPSLALTWQAPTPADGTAFTVTAGEPFTVELAAASSQPQLVLIGKRKLPAGASFTAALREARLGDRHLDARGGAGRRARPDVHGLDA